MDFSDWITRKYIEWRGDAIGNDRSITEFSALFGAKQSLMSQWMKKGGKKPKHHKYVMALEKLYGPEVYDILGLPRPAPTFDIPLESVPPGMRAALIAATRELADTLTENNIDPGSPAAIALTVSIFESHGFIWTSTDMEEGDT